MITPETIENISQFFAIKILKAFDHNHQSMKAMSTLAKSLRELYRYFEPSFFNGKFYIFKHFADNFIFDEANGSVIYDKNMLLNKTEGNIFIQVFENKRFITWEDVNTDNLLGREDVLIYFFEGNREYFFARQEKIEIPYDPPGSMFAPQFYELTKALNDYKIQRVLHSSCPFFSDAWFDKNRIFFKAGGSGSNIPEKHLQVSLFHYLDTTMNLRGITPVLREFNLVGDTPKPVDIAVHWGEANRTALIEVKWLGQSKNPDNKITTEHSNGKASKGLKQLKENYFDPARANMPRAILKAYLVVIDARREGTSDDTTELTVKEGMYYQNVELIIDEDKRFYESIPEFEIPVRMFAAPICTKP